MLTPEDHNRLRFQASRMIAHSLTTMVASGHLSVEAAESYATGVAEGVRDFLTAYVSDKTAFDVLSNAAPRAEDALLAATKGGPS